MTVSESADYVTLYHMYVTTVRKKSPKIRWSHIRDLNGTPVKGLGHGRFFAILSNGSIDHQEMYTIRSRLSSSAGIKHRLEAPAVAQCRVDRPNHGVDSNTSRS